MRSRQTRMAYANHKVVNKKDGVEDTRLEAKAKDTKKNPRPRQPFRGQTLYSRGQGQECSRPRPRTKDTSASALQKKKGLHKNFSGDLQKNKKKRSSQIFFRRSPQKNVF